MTRMFLSLIIIIRTSSVSNKALKSNRNTAGAFGNRQATALSEYSQITMKGAQSDRSCTHETKQSDITSHERIQMTEGQRSIGEY